MRPLSYSGMSTYLECPSKYRHRYIEQTPITTVNLEEALLKGTLAHILMEDILNGNDLQSSFEIKVGTWLENDCKLPIAETNKEMSNGQGILIECVYDYAIRTSQILARCHATYTGSDPIRNRDGGIPQNPLNYPPKAFTEAYNQEGLPELRQWIDTSASRLQSAYLNYSLANISAEAYTYASLFKLPEWHQNTEHIELGFEVDGWRGAIDWIFKTKQGAIVIADHKTSSKAPEGLDVHWHGQLNLYASIYYEMFNKLPDYLAINHLPSQRIIVAEVNLETICSITENFTKIREKIREEGNMHLKRLPTDYNSPCLFKSWQTGAILSTCPYLSKCWPQYNLDLVNTHAKT